MAGFVQTGAALDALRAAGLDVLAQALNSPSATPQARNTYRMCFPIDASEWAELRCMIVVAPDRVKAAAIFAAHSNETGVMITNSILYDERNDVIHGRPYTLPTVESLDGRMNRLFEDFDGDWWLEEIVGQEPNVVEYPYSPRFKAAGRN